MIIPIVGILLVLVFFVLVYFSARTWRATHLTFLSLVFLTSLVLVVLTAMTIKTQHAWRSRVNQLESDVAMLREQNQLLEHGDLTAVVQQEPSLRTIKAELSRVLRERGRVWRGLVPVNVAGDAVTLQTAAPEGAEPRPLAISNNLMVFAFLEADSPQGYRVPVAYLGEFQVTNVANNQATLAPRSPDAQSLPPAASQTTWVLYEMMPRDAHDVLAGLSEDELRQLMPKPEPLSQAAYDAMISSYTRHGERATQQDPPGNRWLRLRLVKPVPDNYTVEVQNPQGEQEVRPLKEVDAAVQETILDRTYDSSGRALNVQLRRQNPIQLQVGDTLLLDETTAQQLVEDGLAEVVEPVYVRRLNDYTSLYRETFQRIQARNADIARVTNETQQVQEALEDAATQTTIRQEERVKLESDVQGFQRERDAVTTLANQLQQQVASLRSQLSQIYRSNLALEQELEQLSNLVEEEIRRRTADLDTTAAVP